jgi:hypothetical protein
LSIPAASLFGIALVVTAKFEEDINGAELGCAGAMKKIGRMARQSEAGAAAGA